MIYLINVGEELFLNTRALDLNACGVIYGVRIRQDAVSMNDHSRCRRSLGSLRLPRF